MKRQLRPLSRKEEKEEQEWAKDKQIASACLCIALLYRLTVKGESSVWRICHFVFSRWPFGNTFSDASTRVSNPAPSSPSCLFSSSLFWWCILGFFLKSRILHAASVSLPHVINSALLNWIKFWIESSDAHARRVCVCARACTGVRPLLVPAKWLTLSSSQSPFSVSHPHSSWGTSCPQLPCSSAAQTGLLGPLWGPCLDPSGPLTRV